MYSNVSSMADPLPSIEDLLKKKEAAPQGGAPAAAPAKPKAAPPSAWDVLLFTVTFTKTGLSPESLLLSQRARPPPTTGALLLDTSELVKVQPELKLDQIPPPFIAAVLL